MLKGFDLGLAEDRTFKVKSNYHTHNYLCGHAGGTVSDYAAVAVECGMEALGVSDHCLPPIAVPDSYLSPDTIAADYLPQFDRAKKRFGERLKIYMGVEIEFFKGNDEYYRRLTDSLDYMIVGQHIFADRGRIKDAYCSCPDEPTVLAYFDTLRAAIESGYFALVAHPDLIFYRGPDITAKMEKAFDQTVRCAAEAGVAVELNANGIRYHGSRYPTELLIELCKKHNAKVAVSSDAHSPDSLCDEYMRALYAYAHKRGLNVTDNLNMRVWNC